MKCHRLIAPLIFAMIVLNATAFADDVGGFVAALVFVTGPGHNNKIVNLTTHMVVPDAPAKNGTVFLWPGIQPSPTDENFLPINNGVLQPVLTWGPSCAPGSPHSAADKNAYASWWISGQYVNTYGEELGYTGCLSGKILKVNPGDTLLMTLTFYYPDWVQAITNESTGESVDFYMDMVTDKKKGNEQKQNYATFAIETYNGGTIEQDVVFTDTKIFFAEPSAQNCRLLLSGKKDRFAKQVLSEDLKVCSIDEMVLHADVNPLIQLSSRKNMKALMSALQRRVKQR